MKPKPHQQFTVSQKQKQVFIGMSQREIEKKKAQGNRQSQPSEEQKELGEVRRKIDKIRDDMALEREIERIMGWDYLSDT